MATRMQQRRGTAAQWTAANPVLAAGEIGFETDTSKFKIGDGVNAWSTLNYFVDGATLIDGAPGLLDTLNELAAAIGDDPTFLTTVATNLQNHADDTTNIHGIANTALLATTADITTHNDDTTNVHGITNTANLVTVDGTQTLTNKILTSPTINDATISNPTGLNSSDVGLGNVDNTSDMNKPISTDMQTALDLKAPLADPTFTGVVSGITKVMVGLAAVDDTSDANKPISIATQAALDLKAPIDNPTFTGVVSGINKSMVGLDQVSNTSDTDKPISNATQAALDLKLDLAGGTLTGFLTTHADPTQALHVANKQYVDNVASGVIAKPQVLAASQTNFNAIYNNGTNGVGATLTNTVNGAFPSNAFGATGWAVGKGILIKDQTNKEENGRYVLTDLGSASTPYVLTRCGLCNESSEIPGSYIFVQGGSLGGTAWILEVADPDTFVIGTDDINVFQFAGAGTYSAGTGLDLNGTEFSVDTSVIATVANPTFTGTVSGITKSMVGLGNVDNTSDADKPVSTATQTALNLKAPLADPTFTGTVSGITKSMVGLGNVDNTSDANKPVSTATQTALDLKSPKADPTFTGTVTVSASGIAFTDATQTKAGVPSLTTITQKTDSYTLSSLTERDTLIEMGKATAQTLTIPTNASVAYPVGTSIDILQTGAGQVTIAGASGVTVNATPGLKLRAQWSSATLMKRATDSWIVVGDLTA
jgi:hypothetical protein